MIINTVALVGEIARQQKSQCQIADLAGISRQALSAIIRRGTCSPKTAGKIAAALDLDVTNIIRVEHISIGEKSSTETNEPFAGVADQLAAVTQ